MKTLVSLLVAYKHYAAHTVIELESDEAAKLIAEKKAVATQLDPSLLRRDHAAPPAPAAADDQVFARALAAAVAPIAKNVEQLGARIEEVARGPRVKATSHVGDVRGETRATVLDEQTGEEVAPEPSLGDVVHELREVRAQLRSSGGVGRRGWHGWHGIEYQGRSPEDGTGLKLARFIRAKAAAQSLDTSVEDVLERWGHKDMAIMVRNLKKRALEDLSVTRANQLGQSTLTDGGALVPEQFSADLIPLLRNATRVRQAGARVITMQGGNLTVPKATAASTASYVGENQPNNLSKPQLGDLKFSEKIMRVDVVLSNSLIQNAALSADAWVRDDMVRQAAIKEDVQALFGKGTAYAPFGIENLLASSRKVDMTAADRTAPTIAEVAAALSKQIKLVKQSNIISPISKLGWIMNSSMEAYLGSLTTTVGAYIYLQQLDAGMLRGYPVFVTEQVPDNLDDFAAQSHTDETRLFFGDFDTLVIAESSGGMQVNVFPNGTYEDNGIVYSGASRDQTYVRLLLKHDINMRYNNTIADFSWRPTR